MTKNANLQRLKFLSSNVRRDTRSGASISTRRWRRSCTRRSARRRSSTCARSTSRSLTSDLLLHLPLRFFQNQSLVQLFDRKEKVTPRRRQRVILILDSLTESILIILKKNLPTNRDNFYKLYLNMRRREKHRTIQLGNVK